MTMPLDAQTANAVHVPESASDIYQALPAELTDYFQKQLPHAQRNAYIEQSESANTLVTTFTDPETNLPLARLNTWLWRERYGIKDYLKTKAGYLSGAGSYFRYHWTPEGRLQGWSFLSMTRNHVVSGNNGWGSNQHLGYNHNNWYTTESGKDVVVAATYYRRNLPAGIQLWDLATAAELPIGRYADLYVATQAGQPISFTFNDVGHPIVDRETAHTFSLSIDETSNIAQTRTYHGSLFDPKRRAFTEVLPDLLATSEFKNPETILVDKQPELIFQIAPTHLAPAPAV